RSMDSEEILNAEIICDYENHFLDVPYEASYLPYVNWAYQNGVIQGTTADTFDPDGNCKRCDLAVMLYRMYGKPSVSGQTIPFTDVPKSAYYYNAVVWAYNKGYIKGTSSKKFNPNGTITRQDMVVILWRMAGSPKVTIDNPFTDVDESSYAYKAIMWAYKNKITSGTSSDKFSPKSNCLRYQLAVFLNKFNNIVHVI
nr:S-layer homology domain-containing protein [Clostridia bacterium]